MGRQERRDDRDARTARDEATITQVHQILRSEKQIVGSDAEKPKPDNK